MHNATQRDGVQPYCSIKAALRQEVSKNGEGLGALGQGVVAGKTSFADTYVYDWPKYSRRVECRRSLVRQ